MSRLLSNQSAALPWASRWHTNSEWIVNMVKAKLAWTTNLLLTTNTYVLALSHFPTPTTVYWIFWQKWHTHFTYTFVIYSKNDARVVSSYINNINERVKTYIIPVNSTLNVYVRIKIQCFAVNRERRKRLYLQIAVTSYIVTLYISCWFENAQQLDQFYYKRGFHNTRKDATVRWKENYMLIL